MGLTVEQALAQIKRIDTSNQLSALAQLQSILDQVAVGGGSPQTILYSGFLTQAVDGGGPHSGAIADGIAELLGSPAAKLEGAGRGQLLEQLDSVLADIAGVQATQFGDWLRTNRETSVGRFYDKMWGDASREFAETARGNVIVVAANAKPDAIFGSIELPALLKNPNVSSINGFRVSCWRTSFDFGRTHSQAMPITKRERG